jgi:hypothetical protein
MGPCRSLRGRGVFALPSCFPPSLTAAFQTTGEGSLTISLPFSLPLSLPPSPPSLPPSLPPSGLDRSPLSLERGSCGSLSLCCQDRPDR